MNSREAVAEELKTAPEPMVEEVLDFVRFLKAKGARSPKPGTPPQREIPDFRARQRALFGDRILPDSQSILDELRADRI